MPALGQATFLDLALMLLERRHMGVAEHRETIRPERQAAADRIQTGSHCLERQTINQVEINPFETGAAKACDRIGGFGKTLYAIDGALDGRIEALHAKARAVDPTEPERLD